MIQYPVCVSNTTAIRIRYPNTNGIGDPGGEQQNEEPMSFHTTL